VERAQGFPKLPAAIGRNPFANFRQRGFNVLINHPDCRAILADIFMPRFRKIAKPGAIALAEWCNPAPGAFSRKIRFEGSEPGAQRTVQKGLDAAFPEISDMPFLEDEKIAGVAVSIMFNHQVAAAFMIVAAGCLDAVYKIQQDVFKEPDRHIKEVLSEPLVKQLDVEFPGFLPMDGAGLQCPGQAVIFKAVDELKKSEIMGPEKMIQIHR